MLQCNPGALSLPLPRCSRLHASCLEHIHHEIAARAECLLLDPKLISFRCPPGASISPLSLRPCQPPVRTIIDHRISALSGGLAEATRTEGRASPAMRQGSVTAAAAVHRACHQNEVQYALTFPKRLQGS